MFQTQNLGGKKFGNLIAHPYFRILCLIVFGSKIIEAQDSLVNKTVYSSLPLFSSSSVPQLAVDGVQYDTNLPADIQCFMTGNHTTGGETCWFAVDLDKLYKVSSITIILSPFSAIHSKLNAIGNLINVTAGVTNSSPVAVTPYLNSYRICGSYGKAISQSQSFIRLFCYTKLPPARYLIIQQAEDMGGYLTICELQLIMTEVFETTIIPPSTMSITTSEMNLYTVQDGHHPMFLRSNGNPTTISSSPNYRHIKVRSNLECIAKCLEYFKERCISSDYRNEQGNCEIASSTTDPLGGYVVHGQDWLLSEISVF